MQQYYYYYSPTGARAVDSDTASQWPKSYSG